MLEVRKGFNVDRPDISYLQPRLDFEEVLEGLGIDIGYKRGDQIMCHCPNGYNHKNGDQNPSFGFDTERMIYNCFVCGGGYLLELVEQQLDLSPEDAVQWLQQMSTMEPHSASDLREKLMRMLHQAEDKEVMPEYPGDALFKYRAIHPYLYERGISKETAIKMQVGFDPDHYGIMIPHWWQGVLRGWQVRHLVSEKVDGKEVFFCDICKPKENVAGKKVAKYNSTVGLPKSRTLYNYDNVMREGFDWVIVVESPFSALYLMSHGYPNVVATFGSFNDEQMQHLSIFRRVLLWPDNDAAGQENVKRAVEAIRYSTEVRIVPVVDKEKGDAADVSPEGIQEYIEKAFSPAFMPFYGTPLVTLDRLHTNTNT
jgi:DNA primase